MIASYKRKSNIAALVFIVSIGATIVLTSNSHQNLWDMGVLGPALGITMLASYIYALWCYIRAKGRNEAWILMAFLNVIGLIVLLLLKDHCKDGAPSATPQGTRPMRAAGGSRHLILCTALLAAAIGTASGAEDDPVSRLRHARSLRCAYTASALTAYMPEGRRITTEHTQMVVVYDNINIERGTARVIYEKGVPGGAGDLMARWQANALWFIETAPAGNLILTTIFSRYAQGTTDFIALDSRYSVVVFISGSMSSGACKALT